MKCKLAAEKLSDTEGLFGEGEAPVRPCRHQTRLPEVLAPTIISSDCSKPRSIPSKRSRHHHQRCFKYTSGKYEYRHRHSTPCAETADITE